MVKGAVDGGVERERGRVGTSRLPSSRSISLIRLHGSGLVAARDSRPAAVAELLLSRFITVRDCYDEAALPGGPVEKFLGNRDMS